VPAGEVPIVCEPAAAKARPRSPYDAKFILPFCVAASLFRDRVGIGAFTEESIGDAGLLGLAARVRYTVDPASPYPQTFPGWVRVRLTDGKTLEAREESQRGGPDRPIAPDDVIAKFRDNAARLLPTGGIAALETALLRIESAPLVSPVVTLSRAG